MKKMIEIKKGKNDKNEREKSSNVKFSDNLVEENRDYRLISV